MLENREKKRRAVQSFDPRWAYIPARRRLTLVRLSLTQLLQSEQSRVPMTGAYVLLVDRSLFLPDLLDFTIFKSADFDAEGCTDAVLASESYP
jgi:hypothetical protein